MTYLSIIQINLQYLTQPETESATPTRNFQYKELNYCLHTSKYIF